MSTLSSFLTPSNSSTHLSIPPPSTMPSIFSTPSTMSSMPPPSMSHILSPSTSMSTILPPSSTMSSVPPPFMSSTLAPSSTMSTIFSPPTMSSIPPPSSSMSTILSNLSPSSLLPSLNTLTPDSNQTKCMFDDVDEALAVPLAVLYSLLFLLGLAGNLLALWVFLFLRRRWDSLHVFLTNSAVADLLLLACLPFRVHYYANRNKWELGAAACKLVITVFYMNMCVSVTLLGLISLDRYAWLRRRAVGARRHSLRSPCGVPWAWVVCGLVWVLALGLTAYAVAKTKPTEEAKCFHYRRWDDDRCIAYVNIFLEVMFWGVFVAQVVSYGKIATSRHGRTARKSFFVLLLFTLCFVPYHAFRPFYIHHQFVETPCKYIRWMHRTRQVMVLISAFNSCLDPVMYFLLSGLMRKAAARMLCTHSYS